MVFVYLCDKNWAVLGRFFQSLPVPCGANMVVSVCGDKQGKAGQGRAAAAKGRARCHFY